MPDLVLVFSLEILQLCLPFTDTDMYYKYIEQ